MTCRSNGRFIRAFGQSPPPPARFPEGGNAVTLATPSAEVGNRHALVPQSDHS